MNVAAGPPVGHPAIRLADQPATQLAAQPASQLADRLADRLRRARLDGDGPLVLLLIATDGAPARGWPWRSYAELARRLRRTRPNIRLGVVTIAAELWPAVRIHEDTARLHPVLGPDLDPDLHRALLGAARLVVANDNRDLSTARSLGVDAVALYGPTAPADLTAGAYGSKVVRAKLWCSPCGWRRCPLLHHLCLRRLPVDTVLTACLAALDASDPKASEDGWS